MYYAFIVRETLISELSCSLLSLHVYVYILRVKIESGSHQDRRLMNYARRKYELRNTTTYLGHLADNIGTSETGDANMEQELVK